MTAWVPLYMNRLPMVPPALSRKGSSGSGTHSLLPLLSLDDILGAPSAGRSGSGSGSDGPACWDTVVLSNYMTDFEWVLREVPTLSSAKRIIVFYGESSKDHLVAAAKASGIESKCLFIKPSLPIAYGTHHSKAALCFSPLGLRVGIFTANFILDDWCRKNQGLFVQDFPARAVDSSGVEVKTDSNPFGAELLGYFGKVGLPPNLCDSLKLEYDFSAAAVRLVPSIPGYHQIGSVSAGGGMAPHLTKFGMERLKWVLGQECPLEAKSEAKNTVLSWQYSSQGSLTEKFLEDLTQVMMTTSAPTQMGQMVGSDSSPKDIRVTFPTEQEVRNSVEGWRGGSSIPVPMKNCHEFINARLHRFTPKIGRSAEARGGVDEEGPSPHPRCRAMPHIKTYLRLVEHDTNDISSSTPTLPTAWWYLLTSSNLSRAAWGDYQKKNTQLMIRSYELGVIFTASLQVKAKKSASFGFCLTPERPAYGMLKAGGDESLAVLSNAYPEAGLFPVQLRSATGGGGAATTGSVHAVIPFDVGNPHPYASTAILRAGGTPSTAAQRQDVPWVVDGRHSGVDALGATVEAALGEYSHYGPGSWNADTLHFEHWQPSDALREKWCVGMAGGDGKHSGQAGEKQSAFSTALKRRQSSTSSTDSYGSSVIEVSGPLTKPPVETTPRAKKKQRATSNGISPTPSPTTGGRSSRKRPRSKSPTL